MLSILKASFFNRGRQCAHFAHAFLQQCNPPVLTGVFFFEPPPEFFMLGPCDRLVHPNLLLIFYKKTGGKAPCSVSQAGY
jgi:hypothetical protein